MAPEESLHIVLIDDDVFLIDMYAEKFRREGYTVSAFAKADEALSELRKGLEPDIVLLDIIMPEMTGIDFLQAISEEQLIPDAALVMLTNQGETGVIQDAQTLGADGYIVKATSVPSEVVHEVARIYEESREPGV